MPWVRGNSLWEYSLNKGDFFDFKNGVDNWDYYSSIEIKCKLLWDIKEAFENANLYPILNTSKVIFLLIFYVLQSLVMSLISINIKKMDMIIGIKVVSLIQIRFNYLI